ncbi:penicillin-insensitive murein endopeptidase [Elusimicrobiota bacterium]
MRTFLIFLFFSFTCLMHGFCSGQSVHMAAQAHLGSVFSQSAVSVSNGLHTVPRFLRIKPNKIKRYYPRSLSEARGFYSNGYLVNASALPMEGDGFVKIERLRDRHYGTEEMIDHLKTIGRLFAQEFPDSARIQIGDLGVKKGGKITMHTSHQNGLDVDIAMIAVDEVEQDPDREHFDEDFVKDSKLLPSFDIEENWAVVRLAALNTSVERIFVAKEIKLEFCKLHGDSADGKKTLHVLRPLGNHSDHFHIRFACPKDDKKCKAQTPVPAGDGCFELQTGAEDSSEEF